MTTAYEVRRHIRARPERIWALLTDAADYPRWNPSVVSLSGEMTDGATITLVSTVDPKRRFTLTVGEVEPARHMVWSQRMPLGLFAGRRTFTLVPVAEGTDVTVTETFAGPLAGVITRVMPDLTESFTQFADGLQAAAEDPGTSTEQPAP